MARFRYFLFVLFFALDHGGAYVPEKIKLTVYYESKCPDSQDFIVDQLLPAMKVLQDAVSLTLVPFGKASSINSGAGGFKCQHGPTECHGNLVQDCALNAMKLSSDLEKVEYVKCEMETRAGTTGNMDCVRQANIPVNEVEQCVNSIKGVDLQLNSEYRTFQVRPRFVPTIIIGETFNQGVQDSALQDLTGTICSMYKDRWPCAQHYNYLAMETLNV